MRVSNDKKEMIGTINNRTNASSFDVGENETNNLLITSMHISGYDNGPIDKASMIEPSRKMGTISTFFAVLKAYCAINVLLLPCSFASGGYLLSPLAMITACFFEGLCAYKLCKVGVTYGISSYPLIAYKAIGSKGRSAVRLLIGLAHL